MEARKAIAEFIANEFLKGEPFVLADDASFLKSGVIDSFGFLELVAFLESTFGIKVRDSELVPENVDSMGALLRFLEKKGAAC
jgi:acyl carrier protein